jgi:hypothetical protein
VPLEGEAGADVRPAPSKLGPRGTGDPLNAFDLAVAVALDYADTVALRGPIDNGYVGSSILTGQVGLVGPAARLS